MPSYSIARGVNPTGPGAPKKRDTLMIQIYLQAITFYPPISSYQVPLRKISAARGPISRHRPTFLLTLKEYIRNNSKYKVITTK